MREVEIIFSNLGGVLERAKVYAESDDALRREIGQRVMEMVRESGCELCPGDTITIREVC